jgi:hypothetical protein
MRASALTDAIIAEARERAATVLCAPLDDRCYGMAFRADTAFAERTPKGWCRIGSVVRDSGGLA